jgi:hypothetical protein
MSGPTMLIKFTGGGRGGGRQVADYLTRHEGRDHAPPEVVRGNMDRTRELIDSIERKWTYTHGVLSFAAEDAPTEEQQEAAMNRFESLAFAGLDKDQFDITWVRHTHTETGRTELHFVSPRMELTSGKAMNIAPPGWESTYAPLRDMLNHYYEWARPDDPARAKELQQPPERALEGFTLREGREGIHAYLVELVASEKVTDRASMVQAVLDAGLGVPREGKDYITVQDPATDERFRMKGRIYEKDWTYDRELDRALAPEGSHADSGERADHIKRAKEALERYQAAIERRAVFNSERYHQQELDDQRGLEGAEVGEPVLVDRPGRDLDRSRGLLSLALDEAVPSAGTHELGGLPDVHAGRSDVSDRAERKPSRELPSEQNHSGLRRPTGREISEDERETDDLRTRLAGTVRNLGSRLQERLGDFREHVQEFARILESYGRLGRASGKEAGRSRGIAEDTARSSERANAAHRGLEGEFREFGEAGKRLARRTAEMTSNREWEERRQRSKDNGLEL